MSLPSASSGLPPDTTYTPDRACHARVISPHAGRVAKVLCPQRLRSNGCETKLDEHLRMDHDRSRDGFGRDHQLVIFEPPLPTSAGDLGRSWRCPTSHG